jgi:DNA-binding protein HU-beta
MIKEELVNKISRRTGMESSHVLIFLEAFMEEVKNKLGEGEPIHLRGFGSFLIKHRKQKTGRIITKKKSIIIPAHNIPYFKPSDAFKEKVKNVIIEDEI